MYDSIYPECHELAKMLTFIIRTTKRIHNL